MSKLGIVPTLVGAEAKTTSEKGISRTLLVHICGNRATFEHAGIHGGLWRINADRAGAVFWNDAECATEAVMAEKLGRAIIRTVTVLESNTNIDEVVAIHIDGMPCQEFTANGEGAAMFLTGEGKVTQPQEIFNMSGNTELGLAWMKQYPKYTNQNLEVEGVMFLTGASYYFVHQEHPAIHMLKANEDTLGVQIRQDNAVNNGDWYKVDIEAFAFCIKSLRENILQNTPSTFNLAGLTVRISKPNGQRWLTICPKLVDSLIPDDKRDLDDASEVRTQCIQRYIDKPLFVTLRLAIEYSLPETKK